MSGLSKCLRASPAYVCVDLAQQAPRVQRAQYVRITEAISCQMEASGRSQFAQDKEAHGTGRFISHALLVGVVPGARISPARLQRNVKIMPQGGFVRRVGSERAWRSRAGRDLLPLLGTRGGIGDAQNTI
ncbi:hypothetical protein ACFFJ7_17920 [Pseudochelatococcus lubricantis]|uniref:hypothetical protein n=1 Tax=Pseudochelatococcus lubricantis TaxID=1538102 RepID=UPI0035E496EA